MSGEPGGREGKPQRGRGRALLRRECVSWPLAGLREWERGYGCLLVGEAIAICWEAPTHRQSAWRYFPLEIGLAKGGQSLLLESAGDARDTQRQIITARGPQGARSESVAKGLPEQLF